MEVLSKTFEKKEDMEDAEKDKVEEAEIAKMDDLCKTKSETSDKEGENFNCIFCPITIIDKVDMMKHVKVYDAEMTEKRTKEHWI